MKIIIPFIFILHLVISCAREWDNSSNAGDNPLVTSGLIAFYPFNGNTNDKSGNKRDGVSANIIFAADRNEINNSAAYFDGDSFVKVQSIGQISSFTIALWYKTIQGGFLIETDNIYMYTDKIHNWFMAVWNDSGGTYCASGNPVYFNDTWHHVVITHDGNNSRIITYFDGVVKHNRPDSGYFTGNNEDIYIGFGTRSDIFGISVTNFSGTIDDIYFFNRAITATEVETLYYDPQ